MHSMAVRWPAPFMAEQGLLRELVRDAKAGDSAAFERIVMLHERVVVRVAQRLLMNSEDAKDAAQEVFLRLHRSLSRFEESRDLWPWLYRVTVNICRDLARRSKRTSDVEEAAEVASKEQGPEMAAIAEQQRRVLLAALATLTQREREAVVLRDLEGRTTAEVAAILGSCEGTVRSQLSTGRVKIRNFVAERLEKGR